jgi:hypothetical protein
MMNNGCETGGTELAAFRFAEGHAGGRAEDQAEGDQKERKHLADKSFLP